MALAAHNVQVIDAEGDIVPNASIRVQRETPGLPLMQLYSDVDGTIPIGNPATTDANGYLLFFPASGGFFKITATKGGFTKTWRRVPIGTAQGADIDTLSGDITFSGFTPDEVVDTLAERDAFDDQVKGFSVLVRLDESSPAQVDPQLYFLTDPSTSPVTWSGAVPFPFDGELSATNITFDDGNSPAIHETVQDALAAAVEGQAANRGAAFATKSAAEAFSPPVAPDFIRTAGYTAAGDFGGGLYKKVANEPSHDGKIQILEGSWYELAEIIITPQMFGVVMDESGATAANTTAFQNMLNFVAATGAEIRLTEGDLYVGEVLPGSAIIMRGAGMTKTNIQFDVPGLTVGQNARFIDFANGSPNVDPFGSVFEDFRIYNVAGSSADGNHTFFRGRLDGANRNIVWNRIWVEFSSFMAFDISDSFNCVWRDFRIRECERGINLRQATFSGNDASTGNVFENGYVSASSSVGIETQGPGSDDCHFANFRNVIFESNERAIHLSVGSQGCTLDGCYFEDNTNAALMGSGMEICCRKGAVGDAITWQGTSFIVLADGSTTTG